MKCNKCEQEKENSSFPVRKDRKNSYRKTCYDCLKEAQRKNYYLRKQKEPFVFKHQKLKQKCKEKNIDYNLTPEFLKGIWTGICPISKEEIHISSNKEEWLSDNSAELDRMIPEKGYVKGNVTWISRKFNMKKLNSSKTELKMILEWMETYTPPKQAHTELSEYKNYKSHNYKE